SKRDRKTRGGGQTTDRSANGVPSLASCCAEASDFIYYTQHEYVDIFTRQAKRMRSSARGARAPIRSSYNIHGDVFREVYGKKRRVLESCHVSRAVSVLRAATITQRPIPFSSHDLESTGTLTYTADKELHEWSHTMYTRCLRGSLFHGTESRGKGAAHTARFDFGYIAPCQLRDH
ncbi:unnamed protein product, partial [Trichogramma brassicae]